MFTPLCQALESRRIRAVDGIVLGPEALVLPKPEVNPGAFAPLAVVDRPDQAPQVLDMPLFGGAFVGHGPDTAHLRVHLAATVRADAAAGSVAQLLGAGLGTGVSGCRQRTLAAHTAAKHPALGLLLAPGE